MARRRNAEPDPAAPAITSPLLTAQEAMAFLRCKRTYLTDHADEIGCVRRGGRLLFKLRDLERWTELHYVAPKADRELDAPAPRHGLTALPGPERMNPVTGRPYGSYGR